MIKTAGGPGLISPLDFNDRKTPRFSKATWVATGIVVAAHLGLGAALYHQRFEMPHVPAMPLRRKTPHALKPAIWCSRRSPSTARMATCN